MTADEPQSQEPAAEATAPEADKPQADAQPRPIPAGRAESVTGGAGSRRDRRDRSH